MRTEADFGASTSQGKDEACPRHRSLDRGHGGFSRGAFESRAPQRPWLQAFGTRPGREEFP